MKYLSARLGQKSAVTGILTLFFDVNFVILDYKSKNYFDFNMSKRISFYQFG